MTRSFTYYSIGLADLTASDLKEVVDAYLDGRSDSVGALPIAAFGIAIYKGTPDDSQPQAERAQAVVIDNERIGISWGGNAEWADLVHVDSGNMLEEAIDVWLNDPAEWEQRN